MRIAAFALLASIAAAVGQEKHPTLHRLTWEEYAATLAYWRKKYPKLVRLEPRGMSGQNMPVYLLRITDPTVKDTDKQVCLVTTLHCGPERSGATGALALTEWLLGGDPLAAETRRKQIVLVMPVVNPLAMFFTDRFRNEHGVDPYTGAGVGGKLWDVSTLTLKRPELAPELAAVVSVIDEYRPEVHADLHGTGLQEYSADQLGSRRMIQGAIMTEVTGGAYSNYALRPWDWRVTEAMVEAGRQAGFPSDRFEADAQRTFWGPELAPLGRKLWHGMPLFYSAHYGYAKYHTMILTQEVAWEQSLIARMQGLFRIGNGRWTDENAPGYPVNRVKHFVGHYVTAYGATAAARRASRVELWNQQSAFDVGFLYPQMDGRESFVVATTAAARKAVASGDLQSVLGANATGIERFRKAGPEIKLAMDTPAKSDADAKIEHGIGFRLRLPYATASNLDVQLNGEPLRPSATDGYESWSADGFTQVQIHVPPAKAAGLGLFYITCAYEPPQRRSTGWMPPAEVQAASRTREADATPPTLVDVAYGDHFRQTMDLWLVSSEKPAPLVFYIHGGGWGAQDKGDIHQHLDVRAFLDAGIAVASINYRFLVDATAAGVTPPLQWPLHDTARALQHVRGNAAKWKIDPTRIAASGVSAGGCAALWLAMHDDMADPSSADPVARQSTRVIFTATKAPQPSLDPKQLVEWIPNSQYGGHAFGYQGKTRPETFAPFLANREKHLADLARYSPMAHASADDPPAFIHCPRQDKPPVKGEPQTDPTHTAVLGLMLRDTLQPLGLRCDVRYQDDGQPGEPSLQQALLNVLHPESNTSKP